MKKQINILCGALAAVAIGWFVWAYVGSHERATVSVNGFELSVRVADTVFERAKGLGSLTEATLDADGMLFAFRDEGVRDFWMKDMEFPIDVLWIKDGKIAQIDPNIQPPKAGEEPERMSSDPVKVQFVLELPAGSVEKYGILSGVPVSIELDEKTRSW